MKAWLCMGSNLNDPMYQIDRATKYLGEKCYIKILQAGKPTQTKPYGIVNQPDFINQLLLVETPLSPQELLVFLKNTEVTLSRTSMEKWGPRIIDIDILFYEDLILDSDDLTIPHKGIIDRIYLLSLLRDLIPDFIHPVTKLSIRQMHDDFNKENG